MDAGLQALLPGHLLEPVETSLLSHISNQQMDLQGLNRVISYLIHHMIWIRLLPILVVTTLVDSSLPLLESLRIMDTKYLNIDLVS